MALTPLSEAQRAAVEALVVAGRLEIVATDVQRVRDFLELAQHTLVDAASVRFPQSLYNLAYDASHAVGEALLAGFGYRTRSGLGQHQALTTFVATIFSETLASQAALHFERMRRKRNQLLYEARPVSSTDAQGALSAAQHLLSAAQELAVQ